MKTRIPSEILPRLRTLEVEVHQACVRGNIVRLRELLHPRFFEFGRSGRKYSRNEVLTAFAGRQEYEILSQDFQSEQFAAGIALLTYRSARINAGGIINRHSLRASLWELTVPIASSDY